MELPWNLCPYCGAAVPGMRREDLTMEEVLHPVTVEKEEELPEVASASLEPAVEDALPLPDSEEEVSA